MLATGTAPPAPPHTHRLRRRSTLAVVLAGACAAALTTAPAHAGEDGSAGERELRQSLEGLVREPDGPPGAIAVLKRGGRTEVVRAGVADLDTGRPPSATDHMRLASTAKALSGAVALQLVDRGALRLDDTIRVRLPQLPRAWGKVTLRQLLQHTSGLPDYTADPEFLSILTADPRHRFDSRRLLGFVAGEPLAFRPGSRYHYSNSDNIAVALMAEAVTGRPYEELLRELVYRPLGMRNTSLPQGFRLPEPYLHGYATEAGEAPEDVSTALSASGVWASGGVVSTPKDLTSFIRAYAGGALLSKQTRKEQVRWVEGASEPAGPGRNKAGLALFRYATKCGVVYGHTGNFPGYTQLAVATPDGKRSLTFSLTTQTNKTAKPQLLAKVRKVQEQFVCNLLRD